MFIWLDNEKYPEYQDTFHTVFEKSDGYKFAVAAFKKNYTIKQNAQKIIINIFADTKYFLYVNGKYIGSGPVCPGGDYANEKPMPVQYYSAYEIEPSCDALSFYVLVQLSPTVQTDVSCGHGGLWIEGKIIYENGAAERFSTDETWECRIETEYKSVSDIDFTEKEDAWSKAVSCDNIWNIKKSPIANLSEEKIEPISVYQTDSDAVYAEFDKIYAGYIVIRVNRGSIFNIILTAQEVYEKENHLYRIKGKDSINYRSIYLDSIGIIKIEGVELNELEDLYIEYSHYPLKQAGQFYCSDEILNKIFEVGRHTTEICRQTIELDSPLHQENLGCTGDYLINSLISYFCFGDTSLSRFDIVRTANYLCENDGKMFHTSYSLIWVMMLYDNYMFSGDKSLLFETEAALKILLNRFDGYIGETGVIENPPNYMFIDWIWIDGYNLHHPPMALGQTVLNAFYYKALLTAEKIYAVIGKKAESIALKNKAKQLKIDFNNCFYDSKKGLYIGGFNSKYNPNDWLPENTDKVYHLKHANILAVLYDLCDTPKELMEKILKDETPIQPYFMHFLIEAIYRTGLFEKYGLKELYKWKSAVEECDKGMKEAWEIFEGYGYDYSHAWGATPTYQLMSKLSGLEIKEAGFKKISLNPNLFGLEFANIKIPTPYGYIECNLGKKHNISIPDEISVL